jgi:predicted peptidase
LLRLPSQYSPPGAGGYKVGTLCQRIGAGLLVAGLYASCAGSALAVTVDDFAARWFTNTQGVLPYRLFIPTNYTPGNQFPLVLFLHGAGERGNDNWYQLVGQTGSLVFASETNQLAHPSFMVAPQWGKV